MTDAAKLHSESDSSDIRAIISQADHLDIINKRRILGLIRQQTHLPFETLNQLIKRYKSEEPCDLDLAIELAEELGRENILFAQSYVWQWNNQGVWRRLEERAVKNLVQNFIKSKRRNITKTTVDSINDLFKNAMFKENHKFDVGPQECVNCLNGELSLVDGKWVLGAHNREHYRITQIPVLFDEYAKAPRFIRFLDEIFAGDHDSQEKQQAILEMMGYTLMAHCRHERFIILVGSGANGKSVLLAVLEMLVGIDNIAGIQPSQFSNKFQRAALQSKLANIVTETKQGEIIDDASLKAIVSGEPSTVEQKFRDPFTMRPFATCWFGTNHLPSTRDFSDALFRRALIILFNAVFKPELGNCDPSLKEKLQNELPGILSLALGAYAKALKDGFTIPESCQKAREEWRIEADQVAQFVEDRCERIPISREYSAGLYQRYKLWTQDNGVQNPLSFKSFRERLTRLGFKPARDNTGARMVSGIKLKI